MPYPDKLVDLSDREHIQVHKNSGGLDRLFISKPVLGRASGKWSIQFTRPLLSPTGAFNGVAVVSLSPNILENTYAGLKFKSGYGVAVLGLDDIVRAGAGIYSRMFGRLFKSPPGLDSVGDQSISHGDNLTSIKKSIANFPLSIIVTADRSAAAAGFHAHRLAAAIGAAGMAVVSLITMMLSIRARRRYNRKITRLIERDTLTGLLNRFFISQHLKEACKQAKDGQTNALMLIDLDNFKTVNDSYGHVTGDRLLTEIGRRIIDAAPNHATVGRLAGDEFAILIAPRAGDDLSAIAQRICAKIAEPFTTDTLTITIGASIGIALTPKDATSPNELLRLSDLALYESKARGRGAHSYYQRDMDQKVQARRAAHDGLQTALNNHEFEAYYQPIIELKTHRIEKFEALIRWNHPTKGLIRPDAFIPVAEESGLIVPIGAWMLDQVCRDVARCTAPITVAVNCSALQLKKRGFARQAQNILALHRLDPSRIIIEITESTLMTDDATTLENIKRLREAGIVLSMDDFGTGYSSLSYLRRYPVSIIKIDRSFLTALDEELPKNMAILAAIVSLAHSLDMTIVAEGIETQNQAEVLTALGCEYGQGYYFGRPMPAAKTLPLRDADDRPDAVACSAA
jgi:diguanylate cyclase (GGDEF)-like protein